MTLDDWVAGAIVGARTRRDRELETSEVLRRIQRDLMKKLLPLAESESRFLSPEPVAYLPAFSVFDAIREISTPAMTEDEFNRIADSLRTGPGGHE